MAPSTNLQVSNCLSERSRDWSELPDDILTEIIKDMSLVDRTMFRAVCKNWKLCRRIPFVCPNTLPLLTRYKISRVTSSWRFSLLSISDLTYEPPIYSVREPPDFGEYCRKMMSDHLHPKILCPRKGWLLLQDGNRFLFFCPFDNKTINLPVLEETVKDYVATFTGTPDQPSDCIVFLVRDDSETKINIATCRCSESSWRIYSSFNNFPGDYFSISNVAYNEPMLYCLSSQGALGAFNPINNKWSIFNEMQPRPENEYRLVETDNGSELMMVTWCSDWLYFFNKYEVFSFDFSEKAWKPKLRIGSRAIYLHNKKPRNITASSLLVEGEAKHLANKIFYHASGYYGRSASYSLETGRTELCYQESAFVSSYTSLWIEPPKIF